jgi:hypothetical protein
MEREVERVRHWVEYTRKVRAVAKERGDLEGFTFLKGQLTGLGIALDILEGYPVPTPEEAFGYKDC